MAEDGNGTGVLSLLGHAALLSGVPYDSVSVGHLASLLMISIAAFLAGLPSLILVASGKDASTDNKTSSIITIVIALLTSGLGGVLWVALGSLLSGLLLGVGYSAGGTAVFASTSIWIAQSTLVYWVALPFKQPVFILLSTALATFYVTRCYGKPRAEASLVMCILHAILVFFWILVLFDITFCRESYVEYLTIPHLLYSPITAAAA